MTFTTAELTLAAAGLGGGLALFGTWLTPTLTNRGESKRHSDERIRGVAADLLACVEVLRMGCLAGVPPAGQAPADLTTPVLEAAARLELELPDALNQKSGALVKALFDLMFAAPRTEQLATDVGNKATDFAHALRDWLPERTLSRTGSRFAGCERGRLSALIDSSAHRARPRGAAFRREPEST